ncbi:unnamed protein product [Durusdinium trenchii]|uniref:Uncharacterized protein n=2 Tax=Durusdinium trenchii TaxID=1381693 RepID=A0ABP0NYP5_9DINO
MGKYGAKTPKRHITWCNSKHVNLLNLGRLSGWNYKSEEYEKHRTATTKVVGDKKTFQGKKKALKNSQHYPYRFGLRVLRILPKLQADGPRVFPAPPADFDPLQCFMSHEFTDMWEDADIPQALWYIRGNRSLNVPAEWKPHFFPSMDCFDFSEGQA